MVSLIVACLIFISSVLQSLGINANVYWCDSLAQCIPHLEIDHD